MSSVHSKSLEIFTAKQFKESVSEPASSNVYLTFGRSFPWANDAAPPQSNTSVSSFYDVWMNMIGAKKITGNDLRHVIPRFDWTANTVYNAYDNFTDSLDLMDGNTKFYVVTDQWNVYKCLANNYGANSTTKPTSTITSSHFQTDDKYIWKYMYTLTAEERLKFTTQSYIPVKTLTASDNSTQWNVQRSAINGGIHTIKITNFGTGYTSNNIYVKITGDGIDANAFAIRDYTTNTLSQIIIDNEGSGYTFANVAIIAESGSGANARAIISPSGGHGSDPLTELGGSYILLNAQLEGDETATITVSNDYRQIALIEDPYYFGTTNIAGNTVINQLTVISLNGSSVEYQEDEYVYQGSALDNSTFRGRVVEWDSSNNIIKLSNVEGTPSNELLTGSISTAARFLNSVTDPELKAYTGKLLYMDNIQPIERATDQTETFQVVLRF